MQTDPIFTLENLQDDRDRPAGGADQTKRGCPMQNPNDGITVNPVLFLLCIVAFMAALGLAMVPTVSESQMIISGAIIASAVFWMAYDLYTNAKVGRRQTMREPQASLPLELTGELQRYERDRAA
jgi:hypothetical protein